MPSYQCYCPCRDHRVDRNDLFTLLIIINGPVCIPSAFLMDSSARTHRNLRVFSRIPHTRGTHTVHVHLTFLGPLLARPIGAPSFNIRVNTQRLIHDRKNETLKQASHSPAGLTPSSRRMIFVAVGPPLSSVASPRVCEKK